MIKELCCICRSSRIATAFFILMAALPIPVGASPSGFLFFENAAKEQVMEFAELCGSKPSGEIYNFDLAYVSIFQLRNRCVKGKRGNLCLTYITSKTTKTCFGPIYMEENPMQIHANKNDMPKSFRGKNYPEYPILFESNSGNFLLFDAPGPVTFVKVD